MNKFNARKTVVNGIRFDSKKEAERYKELKLLEKQGKIKDLETQPKFLLQGKFRCRGKTHREISYYADFMYVDCETGDKIVEDVKSKATITDVYRIKKKLFLNLYGDKLIFFENFGGKK